MEQPTVPSEPHLAEMCSSLRELYNRPVFLSFPFLCTVIWLITKLSMATVLKVLLGTLCKLMVMVNQIGGLPASKESRLVPPFQPGKLNESPMDTTGHREWHKKGNKEENESAEGEPSNDHRKQLQCAQLAANLSGLFALLLWSHAESMPSCATFPFRRSLWDAVSSASKFLLCARACLFHLMAAKRIFSDWS